MILKTVEFSIDDHVANLWLSRPDKRNALNITMLDELTGLFKELSKGLDARILILRGRGKVFSAGADLALMSDVSGKSDKDLQAEAARFFDCFDSLYRIPMPVICYAHGAVHGGANGLVATSDFVFSTADTRFSFSEVKLGLVPATVAPFVVRRMDGFKARQYMISGQEFNGTNALASGLVDRLIIPGEADQKITKITGLLKQNAPGAVSTTKKLLIDLEHRPVTSETRDLTTALIARARRSDEAKEGLKSFFNKSKPYWRIKD
jgi:methylglutaconyl-CoA hydratase